MSVQAGPEPVAGRALDDRSHHIVRQLAEAFLSFDADWRFTECNAAAERLIERRREELIGRELWEVAGLSRDSAFGALACRVADRGAAEDAEVTRRIGRRTRLIAVRAFPLGDGIAAVCRDITAARAAERRLQQSEARYRDLAHGLPAAAWLSRANGELEFINQAMADALGRPAESLLGEGWMETVDPGDRSRLLRVRAQARAGRSSFHYEGRFRRRPARCAPSRSPGGRGSTGLAASAVTSASRPT